LPTTDTRYGRRIERRPSDAPLDIDRVEEIRHETSGETLLKRYQYTWNLDNTVATRTEWLDPNNSAVVTFAYDNRQRLIGETRVLNGATTQYDLDYTYDQLGNRLSKVDATAKVAVVYDYDVHTVSHAAQPFATISRIHGRGRGRAGSERSERPAAHRQLHVLRAGRREQHHLERPVR